MAVIEDAVYSRLSTFAGLTALVSTRTYSVKLIQDPTLPAVSFVLISANRESAMGSDTGDVEAVIEVNAWVDGTGATPAEDASDVAEQVRAAMQRWQGTEATVTIQDSYLTNQRVLFEEDTELYRNLQEFTVWYKE